MRSVNGNPQLGILGKKQCLRILKFAFVFTQWDFKVSTVGFLHKLSTFFTYLAISFVLSTLSEIWDTVLEVGIVPFVRPKIRTICSRVCKLYSFEVAHLRPRTEARKSTLCVNGTFRRKKTITNRIYSLFCSVWTTRCNIWNFGPSNFNLE